MSWATAPATDLEAAIAHFKTVLPGWWFSVCECQVSCDASCAPTGEAPEYKWVGRTPEFNSGFHADLPQPSTLADALFDVMEQALQAIADIEEQYA